MQTEEAIIADVEVKEEPSNTELTVDEVDNSSECIIPPCNIQAIRPEQFFDSLNTTWLIEISSEEVQQYCENKQQVFSTNLGSDVTPIIRYAIKNKEIEITGWDEEFGNSDTKNV